jgi:hypothetical protein
LTIICKSQANLNPDISQVLQQLGATEQQLTRWLNVIATLNRLAVEQELLVDSSFFERNMKV